MRKEIKFCIKRQNNGCPRIFLFCFEDPYDMFRFILMILFISSIDILLLRFPKWGVTSLQFTFQLPNYIDVKPYFAIL